MRDEPPTPASASASIRDSAISDSTVYLTSVDQRGQRVGTQYNAGRDVHVTHHAPTWQPHYEPPLDQAQDLLDALLSPEVPAISSLPSGARMPFAPNPHVVGRDAVRLPLARACHSGAGSP